MSTSHHGRLPLSRSHHDRNAQARTEAGLIERLWGEETTRVVLVRGNESLISGGSLVTLASTSVPFENAVYLGRQGEVNFLAVAVTSDGHAETYREVARQVQPDADWRDLRMVAALLGDLDVGLFTQSVALGHWHRTHRYAPGSGTPTESSQSGWVRVDTEGKSIFPRTDPAVIVLVRDDEDRILLGNNVLWEPHRFSLLAGYVEPGESLEEAAIREVLEECGLLVGHPRYVASQPWPFPASLMVGFDAVLAAGQSPDNLVADGEEIRALRWFSRDELRNCLDEIALPGSSSIARYLIEQWFGEPISQEDTWLGRPR